MQLIYDDLTYLSECAMAAATEAGTLIASYANKAVAVQHKQGGDSPASQVVTEVDLLSEKTILKALQPTCEQYDLALLTEESADDKTRLTKGYFWCVDPMDGTLSFVESVPGYSVSIALVSNAGTPVIGVVYDPVTHSLYSAVQGQGAQCNGEPWTLTTHVVNDRPLMHVCDRGMLQQAYYPKLSEAMQSLASKHGFAGLETLESNGAVLNACRVLETPPGCYFKFPKAQQGGGSLWDFAATAAIYSELGAVASDFYGQPLDLNRTDSTFMNHRGVIFATDSSLAKDIQGLLAVN